MPENLVWRVEDERVDWFVLEDGAYLALSPDDEGLLLSRVFPGLVLDVGALLGGDLSAVLSRVQETADTEAHRSFVERLRASE